MLPFPLVADWVRSVAPPALARCRIMPNRAAKTPAAQAPPAKAGIAVRWFSGLMGWAPSGTQIQFWTTKRPSFCFRRHLRRLASPPTYPHSLPETPGSVPKPRVSVLIPTFRYARYLPQAIESVLRQDLPDLEL